LPDTFIEAGVADGFPLNPDYNNGDQEGFGYYQTTIRDGRRWSAVDAYLKPARSRPNLHVETGAHATGILFEGRRAIGVAYDVGGEAREARADGAVIAAAGAVQSPLLLEHSGIGRPDVLKDLGIEIRHALDGVGENYRDHYATRMNWRVKQPISLNEKTRGLRFVGEVMKYFFSRRGILTLSAGVAHGFVRTRPELASPDIQYHFAHGSYASAAERHFDREPGMTVAVCQLRPESQGSIHIRSADPSAPPLIRPNFLADEIDQTCLIDGMKIARRIVDNQVFDPYRAHEMNPGPDIQSDDQWLAFGRANGGTLYHAIGTCKMGSDPMAVVDDRLRVHGIEGLRVIDASIMPTLASGNTNAPTYMIAEKGADMIKEDAKR